MFLANKTQRLAAKVLEAHIAQRRIAHSYILSGHDDASEIAELAAERNSTDIKEEFTVAFAVALLSGRKKLFGDVDKPVSQRVWKHAHPDVRWVGEDKNEKSIKIAAVREIIQWASLKPYESDWKICIILKAERLTEEAANALLKTLEEPPAHTVFCLLVENKMHLLETIQSRSFEIRLMPMPFQPISRDLSGLDAVPVKEIFETYGSLSRADSRQKLEELMLLVREKIHQLVSGKSPDFQEAGLWLEALDLIYDSKAAIEANANPKLTATRLAMRLRRIFISRKAAII